MKKVLLTLLICIICLTGCNLKKEEIKETPKKEPEVKQEEKIEEKEPEYVDDNPIKVSFYLDEGSTWNRLTEYHVTYQPYTDINWFNIFLSDEQNIPISTIKNNWFDAYNKYENIEGYRIGYEVYFKTNDGKEFYETIRRAKNVFEFSFNEYLYMWVYDDVNATDSWYDHLEPEEVNDETWMSSVKFMATELTQFIEGPINIKVFTFNDDDDFDPETGKYRGNSYSIMQIIPN